MYRDKNFFLDLIPRDLTPLEIGNLNEALMERGYLIEYSNDDESEKLEDLRTELSELQVEKIELETKIKNALEALED